MMHGYDKFFLTNVMENLGSAFDCAVNKFEIPAKDFYEFFLISKVAEHIENGNPKYIAGLSGLELTQTIFDKVGIKKTVFQYPNFERTKEYWAGWILSYYQWHSNMTFASIQKFLSIDTILSLYNPLHEAPEEKFIEAADSIIAKNFCTKPTKLQLLRKAAGLTQKKLSELSGINLRTLQQYEIRLKDINKASGDSINALAKALCCNFYDVMEI